jgi:transposase
MPASKKIRRKHTQKCTVRERNRIVTYYLRYGNVYRTAKALGLDKRMVRYWLNKFFDPKFHCKQLGGKKGIFTTEQYPILKDEILSFLLKSPRADSYKVRDYIQEMFGVTFSVETMRKILKKLNWSWKVPTKFQTNKYSISNLNYYCDYIQTIQMVPLEKLKFADESHIVSRDLVSKKVLQIIGKRAYTQERTLNAPSASLTILTSLTNELPLFFDYRLESNTQWDFVEFVFQACSFGFLVEGDFLVIDNATIHDSYDSVGTLKIILDTFKIKIIKLPTYSPELNPCELVFAQMKKFIRKNRFNKSTNILQEVTESLSTISKQNIYNYYVKCVCPKIILPEFVC